MSDVDTTNEQAEFDAGFDDTAAPTTTPDEEQVAEQSTETSEEQAPEVVQPKYAQITQEQFDELMAKAKAVDEIKSEASRKFDNAFGQLGGLKQVIERLQKQPTGQTVQVSEEDFAELKSEFPELADLQIKGLNRALSKVKSTPTQEVDLSQYAKTVEQIAAEARADAIDSLNDIIPDWEKAVQTPEYQAWIAQQPDEIKALEDSDKVRDARRLLRAFKNAPKKQAEPAKPAPVSTRQRLLDAAVNPRSAGGHAPARTDEDEFDAGFNSR